MQNYNILLKYVEFLMLKDKRYSEDDRSLIELTRFFKSFYNDKEFFYNLIFNYQPMSVESSVNLMFFTSEFLLKNMSDEIKNDVKFFKKIYDAGSQCEINLKTSIIRSTYSDIFRHASKELKQNHNVCKYMLERDKYGELMIEIIKNQEDYSTSITKETDVLKQGFEKFCKTRNYRVKDIKKEFNEKPELQEFVFENYESTEFIQKILVRR